MIVTKGQQKNDKNYLLEMGVDHPAGTAVAAVVVAAAAGSS